MQLVLELVDMEYRGCLDCCTVQSELDMVEALGIDMELVQHLSHKVDILVSAHCCNPDMEQ